MRRIWGVRHIRWLYLSWRFARFWEAARSYWMVPNQRDIDYLQAVWDGEA